MSPRDRLVERYQAEMGEDARRRQCELAASLWSCCGEDNLGPHHVMCKHYVEAPAKPIDGQTALA